MIDHEIRKRGIGGSDVAALFGEDEFKNQFDVWADKKGGLRRDEPDAAAQARMMMGKVLEPAVLDLYGRVTGYDVEPCDITYQHPAREFQVYTPDALVRGQKRGVDAKVVFWDQRGKWGSEDDKEPDIPPRVLFQCWWYMSAMDYPHWDVCALLGDGLPRVYTVQRLDPFREEKMLTRAEEWWRRYIVGGDRPEFGESEHAARWLQQVYPDHKRPDMREATAEEADILAEYVVCRIAERKLKGIKTNLESQIKDAIKEREGLNWGDGHAFTWRKSKDSEKMDWHSMAIALLTNFVKDPAERLTIEQLHTRTKEGIRRIHVNHPNLNRVTRRVIEDEEVTV